MRVRRDALPTCQSPQALTCFQHSRNWKQQNRVLMEGRKWPWLLSFREPVSLLRTFIGVREGVLFSRVACIRQKNLFLYGLDLPAPKSFPIQLRLKWDYSPCQPWGRGPATSGHSFVLTFSNFVFLGFSPQATVMKLDAKCHRDSSISSQLLLSDQIYCQSMYVNAC